MSQSGPKLGSIVREVLVLVAGILIAFGLDAWWNRQVERSEVEAELGSVLSELHENRELVDRYVGWHGRALGATETMLLMLKDGGETVLVPDSVVWGVTFTPTFDPQRGAMDALLSSGRLALVEDPALRSGIAGFGRQLLDARDEEIRARDYSDLQLANVLLESGDMSRAASVNWRDGELTPEIASRHTLVRRSEALINHLARRRLFAILSVESLKAVGREIDRLVDGVQSQFEH